MNNIKIEKSIDEGFASISNKIKDISEKLDNSILKGATLIANMSEDEIDNLDPADAPGGYEAYMLYEAKKLLPKYSDKLKRVTDYNSLTLWQDYIQIANINGIYYGITHYEDPDNIEGQDESKDVYLFAYHKLDETGYEMTKTFISTKNIPELINDIKESQKH